MDPQACFNAFLWPLQSGISRREGADNYRQWVDRGGFLAVVMFDGKRREVAKLCTKSLRIYFAGGGSAHVVRDAARISPATLLPV